MMESKAKGRTMELGFTPQTIIRNGKQWIVCTFPDGDVVAIRKVKQVVDDNWKVMFKATSQKGDYGHEALAMGWFSERMKAHIPDDATMKLSIVHDHE